MADPEPRQSPAHVAAQDGFLVLAYAMQGEHGLGRVEANALELHVDIG